VSEENVEIVQRYFGALIRRVATYCEDPGSISEALKTGDLDPDSREGLALTHPDQRLKNDGKVTRLIVHFAREHVFADLGLTE
jgi:hypothetical protein